MEKYTVEDLASLIAQKIAYNDDIEISVMVEPPCGSGCCSASYRMAYEEDLLPAIRKAIEQIHADQYFDDEDKTKQLILDLHE